MRTRLMSFLGAAILVAVASSGRRADAQVSIGGTFSGPHGVVAFKTGIPYVGGFGYRTRWAPSYRYGAASRYAYSRYSYPRSSFYPRRYRLRRFFVAFPYPHYVIRRIYFAPADPYCGGYSGYDGY